MDEIVADHRVALVANVRQFDRYECDEDNVEKSVQHIAENRQCHSERCGERVLLVLLALAAALRGLFHVSVQFHDNGHCDKRAEPRGRDYECNKHHAETEAHEAFGAQWEEDDQTALECECHYRVVGEALCELEEQVEQFAGGVRVAGDTHIVAISGEQQQAIV